MIELDDCGKELRLLKPFTGGMDAKIIMVINGPRGTMALFEPESMKKDIPTLGWTMQTYAIKTFMRRHKDD